MGKYIAFTATLLLVIEVAISRSWHGHYDNEFGGHNPWYHRFDHHSHHNHGWDRSKSSSNPWTQWSDNTDDSHWWNTRRSLVNHNDLQTCMASCPVPLEYDPVCGTDNVTYKNIKELYCARQCGVAVAVLINEQCFEENSVAPKTDKRYPTLTNGWELLPVDTSSTSVRLTGTATLTDINACISACVKSNINSPVCGSDGFIYNNEEHLYCAQICGIEVTISGLAACTDGNNGGNGDSEWTTKLPIPNEVTTLPPDVTNCIRSCPITQEYNPLCGSNGVTYNNYGHLRCAQLCGVDVSLRRKSPCTAPPNNGGDIVATTQPPLGEATTMSEAVRECIRSCPVTPEYSPVCGTNNVTYSNQGRLECAKHCGVAVNIVRFTTCSVEPISTTTPKPATMSEISPNPLLIDPAGPNPQQVTQGTTIPPDVLDSVFTFTDAPTTEEAEVSVDPRFNSETGTINNPK